MRSITVKLLLAFLGVSLVSVVLLVLLFRWSTDREFRNFLFTQSRTNIINTLTAYYSTNGSWDGVDQISLASGFQPPFAASGQPEGGRRFFTLVGSQNQVILAGPGDYVGEVLPQQDVQGGLPIKVNGKTVGTMVTRQPEVRVNPAETAFLDRVKQLYILGGAGVILLALLLAFLLSRTFTRPIRELTAATRAVSAGKLTQEVPVRSRDELGELSASFNRMNRDLVRSNELRRQMTADIAHELRTPVSVILGHAEGVHDGVLKPTRATFEIIRDEASRLEHLIEDLRTLSRADAGELTIDRRTVSPAKLLQAVQAVNNHRAMQKGISIQTEIPSDLPPVSVDPDRMMQVLSNTVDNALRYTPDGGSIVLSAGTFDGSLEIRVQDSGPGVPETELEHIFDRFYRADHSRQRDEGGSGLGLAIARSLVEKHNGRIRAESTPGQGLTIVIQLPVEEKVSAVD